FPGREPPAPTTEEFDSQIVKWGSRKLPALYKFGPQHNEPLPDAILLYPSSLERSTREALLNDLTREIQLQTGQRLSVKQQRVYQVGSGERMASSLMRIAREIAANFPRGLALVVLWDRFL